MLTTKERAYLRSKGHVLPDLVFVGKDGVTDNVLNQVRDNLHAHELIKLKVQKNAGLTLEEVSQTVCEATKCESVSMVGSKIVFYKRTTKEKFRHYL